VIERAMRRLYDVRVGLEDTLVLPDGRTARDNGELVAAAASMASAAGLDRWLPTSSCRA
jgi:uncharacterized protein (DUF849 family)